MLTAAGKMLKSRLCWNLFTVIENKEHTHEVPLCDITMVDFQDFRAGSQAAFSRLLLQINQEALNYSVIDSSPTITHRAACVFHICRLHWHAGEALLSGNIAQIKFMDPSRFAESTNLCVYPTSLLMLSFLAPCHSGSNRSSRKNPKTNRKQGSVAICHSAYRESSIKSKARMLLQPFVTAIKQCGLIGPALQSLRLVLQASVKI